MVKCANYRIHDVCNRLVTDEAAETQPNPEAPLCDCCKFNAVIPDLSIDGNRALWARLEAAKRRLFYQLDRLGLPRGTEAEGFDPPLSFDFKTDALPTGVPGQWKPMGGEGVLTGHANGKVTINLKEADDAERVRTREQMGEDYRTLIGHFRHEIGHYYWDLLIQPHPDRRARYDALFGDPDRPTYSEALDRHYQEGPPAKWAETFTSSYATMHSWEDWAETWAAYLEVLSTLDTAEHLGLIEHPPNAEDGLYERERDVQGMLGRYRELGIKLNELNRAMGLSDLLTRQFPAAVTKKMKFIDEVVRGDEG